MIPKNTTNQEQIAEQNAKQFRHEVEQVEDYILMNCSLEFEIFVHQKKFFGERF